MQLSYAITFDEFKELQPPFTVRLGSRFGFKAVVAACVLIASLGVFCLIQGLGVAVGGFLFNLGLIAALAACFYEQSSVNAKRKEYERNLALTYQSLHCRDQRIFAADEDGFTASCKCGTVTRPWQELVRLSETNTHFALTTKMGGHVIPKAAFPSEAEVTRFRAFATGKLNHDKPLTASHVDFNYEPTGYRGAF
jgi:hypothetical protein